MFCPNCGEQLSDDAKFCGSCGMKIEDEPVFQSAKPSGQKAASVNAAELANKAKAVGTEALNKANAAADSATEAVKKVIPGMNKTIFIISCAVVLVIIVLCFVIFANMMGGGSSSAYTKPTHYAYNVVNGSEIALFVDGKSVSSDISYGEYYSHYEYVCSADAFIYGNSLYKYSNNKLSEVNDDVEDYIVSSSTNSVVYFSDGALCIYKDGKESRVFDGFEGSQSSVKVAVSPNGNTVVFTDKDGDDIVAYIYKGSKAEKLGKNICPVAVSDDASALYAYKFDSDGRLAYNLYFYKNASADNSVKLKSDVSSIKAYSADAKKILFTTSSGTYYFAPNLEDAIKVDSSAVVPIFPDYTLRVLDDFKDFLAVEGYTVKRYTLKGGSFEKYTIASSISSYKLSADGSKLLYLKNGNLYSISTINEKAEAVKLGEDIRNNYYSNADLTKIYAVNDEGELVFSNGNSTKPTKIADDVKFVRVSSDGVCCYVVDDVLYTTSGGSKGSKVDKMNDVSSIAISGGKYFFVSNDGVLYLSSNGRSFDKTSVES